MRCKKCDYRLWNLPSRVCPECGQPFRPSEFEFPVNSVQFRCPHCNQSYYGTGEKGHLLPTEFECVSCHRQIHMDEMVLLPTEGIEEEQTKIDTMPWLERDRRGPIRAWFASVKMALVTPGRLIHTVPESTPVGSAVWFAFFSNGLIYGAGLLTILVVPLIISLFAGTTPDSGMPGGTSMAIGIAASFAGMVVAAYIAVIALMLLTGLVAHGLLRLTGRPQCSLGRTYHAICYSSGANLPSAIPCVGLYFGWVWWLISATVMLKHGQKVDGLRAAFAVLTMPLITLGTLFGLAVWGISNAPIAALGSSNQGVCQALLDYSTENSGSLPEHAIQLVADGYLVSFDLVDTMSGTGEEDVPLADTTLDKFELLSDEQMAEVVQSAVDALPDGTIAHRLGDFVFTYHGIDLSTADPGLWLVIMSPDPDVSQTPARGPQVIWSQGSRTSTSSSIQPVLIAGFADGHVEVMPAGSPSVGLAAQNTLRAKFNLPPLPDPATVTHAKPAVTVENGG